jgi:hypothetical protein
MRVGMLPGPPAPSRPEKEVSRMPEETSVRPLEFSEDEEDVLIEEVSGYEVMMLQTYDEC